jgi:hypothetical protein
MPVAEFQIHEFAIHCQKYRDASFKTYNYIIHSYPVCKTSGRNLKVFRKVFILTMLTGKNPLYGLVVHHD